MTVVLQALLVAALATGYAPAAQGSADAQAGAAAVPEAMAAPDPTPNANANSKTNANPTPTATAIEPCPDGQAPVQYEEDGWVDLSHQEVERELNTLVLRLNRFFGATAREELEPPTSRIRLRNEVRFGEDDPFAARTRVSASLRLPAAESLLSRFSLVLTGETEPVQQAPDSEFDRLPPRFAGLGGAGGGIELNYDLFRARHTLVDVGAGIRFGMPPPPYTRVRLAQAFPLGISIVGQFAQSLFWDEHDGFGEATRLDIERAFGPRTLARWWSVGAVDERSRGYEWASEIGVQRVLAKRTAIYPAAAITGATRSIADVENYRLFTRLRQDVHRGWMFVEVEPEIAWPADRSTGHRVRALGIILRLDLLFSTNGKGGTPLCEPSPPREMPIAAGMS